MKKNLLLLASLAVLTSGASAAQSQPDVVVLPTCVVQTPRFQPAEQQVNANLNELRALASTPLVVTLELPALKAQVSRPAGWSQNVRHGALGRIAKS